MDGLSENEIAAIEAASASAGEYLEAMGQTDLAKMTESQWFLLLEAIVTTALDKLADLALAQNKGK